MTDDPLTHRLLGLRYLNKCTRSVTEYMHDLRAFCNDYRRVGALTDVTSMIDCSENVVERYSGEEFSAMSHIVSWITTNDPLSAFQRTYSIDRCNVLAIT